MPYLAPQKHLHFSIFTLVLFTPTQDPTQHSPRANLIFSTQITTENTHPFCIDASFELVEQVCFQYASGKQPKRDGTCRNSSASVPEICPLKECYNN